MTQKSSEKIDRHDFVQQLISKHLEQKEAFLKVSMMLPWGDDPLVCLSVCVCVC